MGERECTESIGGVNWSLVLQYFGRSTAVRSSRMEKPTTMATISIIFILNQARRALERERSCSDCSRLFHLGGFNCN